MLTNLNLALRFILELCMLAAFAYWGIHSGQNLLMKVLLGAGAPLLVAIFWGVFMAPRSPRRVQNPLYLIFKTILFGLAVIALIAAGKPTLGWVLGTVYVVNSLLDFLL